MHHILFQTGICDCHIFIIYPLFSSIRRVTDRHHRFDDRSGGRRYTVLGLSYLHVQGSLPRLVGSCDTSSTCYRGTCYCRLLSLTVTMVHKKGHTSVSSTPIFKCSSRLLLCQFTSTLVQGQKVVMHQ